MSHVRSLSLLLVVTALVAACSAPTSPEPRTPAIEAPSFNQDTTSDSTNLSGYSNGHG